MMDSGYVGCLFSFGPYLLFHLLDLQRSATLRHYRALPIGPYIGPYFGPLSTVGMMMLVTGHVGSYLAPFIEHSTRQRAMF